MRAELKLGSERIVAQTKDLSMGGVGLVMPRGVSVGEALVVDLFLVNEESPEDMTGPLDVQGEVAWVKPGTAEDCEAGISFLNLSPAQERWLARYIQRSA